MTRNIDTHDEARQLIALAGAEDLSDAQRTWLRAHLQECVACRDYEGAAGRVVRSLCSVTFAADSRLVRATQMRVRSHAQTGHPHQPHAFPGLPKPAGVEAHSHLRSSHQAGIGSERQRTQSTNHPVCCFRIMTACFAFIEVDPQPDLLHVGETFTQSDQLPCLVMSTPRHACAPFSRGISIFNPRYSRDFTVPSGAPVTVAISSKANPS